ncbi:hypothetical protein PHISP_08672, partial [Aspergillus sp. HF37]
LTRRSETFSHPSQRMARSRPPTAAPSPCGEPGASSRRVRAIGAVSASAAARALTIVGRTWATPSIASCRRQSGSTPSHRTPPGASSSMQARTSSRRGPRWASR